MELRAFKIPTNILEEWRNIGANGEKFESEWLKLLNNSNKKTKETFNNINNKLYSDKINKIILSEKLKYADEKPNLATRQCSMKVIESIKEVLKNLSVVQQILVDQIIQKPVIR